MSFRSWGLRVLMVLSLARDTGWRNWVQGRVYASEADTATAGAAPFSVIEWRHTPPDAIRSWVSCSSSAWISGRSTKPISCQRMSPITTPRTADSHMIPHHW